MLANKLWRRTTARKQAPQREPAWSQPHKPAPVTLSLVLVSRDSSRISRYPAASPESTGLTSGLPFVRRQGREHALQSSHNRLLRVVSQDPLANDSLRVDDDVGREGMNPKRLLDFSRRIAILIPIHFLFGNKFAPLIFFLVCAHADQHDLVPRVLPGQLFEFTDRCAAGWAPGRPKIEHHKFPRERIQGNRI